MVNNSLPSDAAARKAIPLASGLFDYFTDALVAVAQLSCIGNAQHNPGKPLHWDRTKSTDHDDCLLRHFVARGTIDTDGVRHRTKVAWRALAALQEECEAALSVARMDRWLKKPPAWQPKTARQLYDETTATAQAQDANNWHVVGTDADFSIVQGIPAESAYLASFSPNAGIAAKSPNAGSRIATQAELDGVRDLLTPEELKGFGIGDVGHVAPKATCVTDPQHPLHHVTLPDDRL